MIELYICVQLNLLLQKIVLFVNYFKLVFVNLVHIGKQHVLEVIFSWNLEYFVLNASIRHPLNFEKIWFCTLFPPNLFFTLEDYNCISPTDKLASVMEYSMTTFLMREERPRWENNNRRREDHSNKHESYPVIFSMATFRQLGIFGLIMFFHVDKMKTVMHTLYL